MLHIWRVLPYMEANDVEQVIISHQDHDQSVQQMTTEA